MEHDTDRANLTKERGKKRGLHILMSIVCIVFFIQYFFVNLVKYRGLYFINHNIETYLFAALLFSIFVLILYMMKKNIKTAKTRKIAYITFTAAFAAFLTLYIYLNTAFAFGQLKPYQTFTSPSGKNTVIVLEGGLTDTEYQAHPVKFGLFYRNERNGFVTRHDYGGHYPVSVAWLSEDEARVHIDFGSPWESSSGKANENDSIVVTFY